jgi:hypothetical protein
LKEDATQKFRVDDEQENRPLLRIPGFLNDDDIGLGDAVKELTTAIGIRPCGECERRAAKLNRWLVLKGRHKR